MRKYKALRDNDRGSRWYPYQSSEAFDKYLSDAEFRKAHKDGKIALDGSLIRESAGMKSSWAQGRDFANSGKKWTMIRAAYDADINKWVVGEAGEDICPENHIAIFPTHREAVSFVCSAMHHREFNSSSRNEA